ncbi:hypothetical protein ACIRFH_35305 [Streptomyces sp. NPDC093586]|uniref:hypothetical protein n=1 Tax=Streptomyces sp. NPDC093586 TaxID=3366042 RepID=UPI00381D8F1E
MDGSTAKLAALLAEHGVTLARLEPAPPLPARKETLARVLATPPLICLGDQIGPCAACHRPTHKYGRGARSPLCEYCDAKAVERWGRTLRAG